MLTALIAALVAADPPPLSLPDGGVVGTLPKEHIRQVIKAARPAIADCYAKLLARRELNGKFAVLFVIGPSGGVTSAEPHPTSTLVDAEMNGCVIEVIKGLRFKPPTGGGSVTVTYPFVFGQAADGGTPLKD